MKRFSAAKYFPLVCLLTLAAAGSGFPLALGTVQIAIPHGVKSGWAFPPGRPSHLGLALLYVEAPVPELNQKSGVWFLQSVDGNPLLKSYETYDEPIRVACGDLDGDGYQDAVVLFTTRPAVRFIIGRGGDAPQLVSLSLPTGPAVSLGVDDVTADSLADLVVLDSTKITILARTTRSLADSQAFQPYPSFEAGPTASLNPLATDKFLFGDFDGNFRRDFIVRGFLYLNLNGGRYIPKQLPDFGDAARVRPLEVVADLDGDGKAEFLFSWKTSATSASNTAKAADYEPLEVLRVSLTLSPTLPDSSSALVMDYDRDGLLDLGLFANVEKSLRLYRGTPTGIVTASPDTLFTDPAARGSFLGPFDLGADGKTDWMFWSQATDSLYIRYQLQSFVDRTAAAGLDLRVSGQAAAVADYDNDGDLEVFVINFSGTNLLLSGSRDGTFTDVALQAGVSRSNDGISCAWGDYDNDGYADLYVAGLTLPDKLFHNNGNGTFADSSRILSLNRGGQRATSVSWGDVNRDGWLDILIGNYDGSNILLLNRSGRFFENRSKEMGLVETNKTESAAFVDVNGDGWLDIFTLNADGPNRLLMGSARGVFYDSTATSGLNPGQEYKKFGQTQTWGDFNGDGQPDLYI
ncbi:MAG: VCBS repeat-containing protein, partial [Candidatus Glassbacteria bacterium]